MRIANLSHCFTCTPYTGTSMNVCAVVMVEQARTEIIERNTHTRREREKCIGDGNRYQRAISLSFRSFFQCKQKQLQINLYGGLLFVCWFCLINVILYFANAQNKRHFMAFQLFQFFFSNPKFNILNLSKYKRKKTKFWIGYKTKLSVLNFKY